MTAQTESPRGSKKNYCPRHKVSYGALEQCGRCEGDPGPAPLEVAVKLPKPPRGCMSSEARERWYTALAESSLRSAAKLTASKGTKKAPEVDFHGEAAIRGHRETAIKAMRAASELGNQRETDAIVEARKREGARGGHH